MKDLTAKAAYNVKKTYKMNCDIFSSQICKQRLRRKSKFVSSTFKHKHASTKHENDNSQPNLIQITTHTQWMEKGRQTDIIALTNLI